MKKILVLALLAAAQIAVAGPAFPEFTDPNPSASNGFGTHIVPLSTGNVVITSPQADVGATDVGAVYLFNGATGALISTLLGSTAGDGVGGGGVTALPNGNFVVRSPSWDNGAVVNAGAVTWGSGTTGVSGVVSAGNSLVGSATNDLFSPAITILANGNYLVSGSDWSNGGATRAGSVTWGNAATGVSGVVSAANSLVGSTASDSLQRTITTLANGSYVVRSTNWDNGAATNAGAVTWGSGTAGVSGEIGAANSLVGTAVNDSVGGSGIVLLTSGNYLVLSPSWDNGAVPDVGAATRVSGATGLSGPVSAANSLVGGATGNAVGSSAVALPGGNYVVLSPGWDDGAVLNVGAATWVSSAASASDVVSAANSLIGSGANNNVGGSGAMLANGNYVVLSPGWDAGAATDVGAVTWADGSTGLIGVVSAANSLVGTQGSDQIGSGGVLALKNGNYVVRSTTWSNGASNAAGAITWGNGTVGVTGAVSAANSLVGTRPASIVGSSGVTELANGNYVVASGSWDIAGGEDAGAVTWCSGTSGLTGAVSAANSLVGSTASDSAGSGGVVALVNGNYVVASTLWDNAGIANIGAVTWGSGTAGITGTISASNSLVGSTTSDGVGSGGIVALSNGNYVVSSTAWGAADLGAVTWASGTTGLTGTVSASNSLIGATASDSVGSGGVVALPNGNYLVRSANWDSGTLINAGAVSFGLGLAGVTGTINTSNSAIGSIPNASPQAPILDSVNNHFIVRFSGEGKVRVGSQLDGFATSALQSWRQLYFGTIANTGNAADTFDFDRDGLVNVIEFAFGLNPTQPSQLPSAQLSGDQFFYSITQPPGVTGLTYGAEWSTTLQSNDWHSIPTPAPRRSTPSPCPPSARRKCSSDSCSRFLDLKRDVRPDFSRARLDARLRSPGSTGVSRVGFGVPPKRTFGGVGFYSRALSESDAQGSSSRRDAETNARDERATRNPTRTFTNESHRPRPPHAARVRQCRRHLLVRPPRRHESHPRVQLRRLESAQRRHDRECARSARGRGRSGGRASLLLRSRERREHG